MTQKSRFTLRDLYFFDNLKTISKNSFLTSVSSSILCKYSIKIYNYFVGVDGTGFKHIGVILRFPLGNRVSTC